MPRGHARSPGGRSGRDPGRGAVCETRREGQQAGDRAERGSAVVEFLATTIMLIVPLTYLVLTLGSIQSATFAAESAARDAGRIVSLTEDVDAAIARAALSTEYAFADHGIAVDGREALRLECSADPCRTPGERVWVEVSASVRLPLVPDLVAGVVPVEVPVSASHVAMVPAFEGES